MLDITRIMLKVQIVLRHEDCQGTFVPMNEGRAELAVSATIVDPAAHPSIGVLLLDMRYIEGAQAMALTPAHLHLHLGLPNA
jgi:hypothetical protein